MSKLRTYLLAVMLIMAAFTLADSTTAMQAALKKIYPEASGSDWSRKGNYFIANFMQNGTERVVWFDSNANWIMTQTNAETIDNVSPTVYNAFTFGQYSDWPVDNVTFVEYKECPQITVIEVSQYNMETKYQLVYSQDGNLLNTRNVSYIDDTLWPAFFNCE